jgi:hypothetical protein
MCSEGSAAVVASWSRPQEESGQHFFFITPLTGSQICVPAFVKIMVYSIDSYVTSACEPLFQGPRRCVVCVDPRTDAPLNLRAESKKFLPLDSSGEAQSSAIFAVRICNLHSSLFIPQDTPLRLCDVSLARSQSQSAFQRANAPTRQRALSSRSARPMPAHHVLPLPS